MQNRGAMQYLQASKYYKRFVFVITNIIIIAFLCQSIVWAQGGAPLPIQGTSKSPVINPTEILPLDINLLPSVAEISVPEDLAKIQDRFQGNNGKIVIHIQDSHANYEAQKNYAQALERVVTPHFNGSKKLMAMEGAEGPLDVTLFKTIPDKKIQSTVVDYFMKNGYLNGAEYFAIYGSNDLVLYGVEEMKLYQENLEVFRLAQEMKPVIANLMAELQEALAK